MNNSIIQPPNLKINLYPHQLKIVAKMEEIEQSKLICVKRNQFTATEIAINADIKGYGKTLSMISLILRDKMDWFINEPHEVETVENFCDGKVKNIKKRYYKRINTTIVLCDDFTVNHWLDEFSYTPLKVQEITDFKSLNSIDVEMFDTVICTPNVFNKLIHKYENYAWKRFIFDEPCSVRVPSMKNIVSGFTWLITSTPYDIRLKHKYCVNSFMYSIFGDRSCTRFLEYIIIKNDDEYVRQSFIMPITRNIYHNCFSGVYKAVNGLVNERINNMIEAGNIEGAIQALGGEKTDNIVELAKKNKNIELIEIRERIRVLKSRGEEENLLKWINAETVLINQLTEIENRFNNVLNGNCSICYEKFKEPVVEPFCQNIFCGSCIFKWLKTNQNCPFCRKEIDLKQLIYIATKEDKQEKKIDVCTKEDKILELINSGTDKKFVIYSSWNETFTLIRSVLDSRNIPYLELKGEPNNKFEKMQKFKKGQINVAFLNSRNETAGINIQETTDLILYHKLSDGDYQQILEKANRIGRTKHLTVHHLVLD